MASKLPRSDSNITLGKPQSLKKGTSSSSGTGGGAAVPKQLQRISSSASTSSSSSRSSLSTTSSLKPAIGGKPGAAPPKLKRVGTNSGVKPATPRSGIMPATPGRGPIELVDSPRKLRSPTPSRIAAEPALLASPRPRSITNLSVRSKTVAPSPLRPRSIIAATPNPELVPVDQPVLEAEEDAQRGLNDTYYNPQVGDDVVVPDDNVVYEDEEEELLEGDPNANGADREGGKRRKKRTRTKTKEVTVIKQTIDFGVKRDKGSVLGIKLQATSTETAHRTLDTKKGGSGHHHHHHHHRRDSESRSQSQSPSPSQYLSQSQCLEQSQSQC